MDCPAWLEPLTTVSALAGEINRPEVIALNALACDGLTCGDPQGLPVFHGLMHDGVPIQALKEYFHIDAQGRVHGISTCQLVADGLRRRAGVDHPYLWDKWVPGQGIAQAIAAAKLDGAWVDCMSQNDLEPRPSRGAWVLIGCHTDGEMYQGTEHVLTAIEWDGDMLTSIDGGQVDMQHFGLQCIRKCQREWRIVRGRPWLLNHANGQGRRVRGWIEPSLCRYRLTAQIPLSLESQVRL